MSNFYNILTFLEYPSKLRSMYRHESTAYNLASSSLKKLLGCFLISLIIIFVKNA